MFGKLLEATKKVSESISEEGQPTEVGGVKGQIWYGAPGGGFPDREGALLGVSEEVWNDLETKFNTDWWSYAGGPDGEDDDGLQASETTYGEASGWVVLLPDNGGLKIAKDTADPADGIMYFTTDAVPVTIDGKAFVLLAGVSGV